MKKKDEITAADLKAALKDAGDRAIRLNKALGNSWLMAEGDYLYRMYPDGRKEFFKALDYPLKKWNGPKKFKIGE